MTRVLWVDDNPDLVESVRSTLESAGIELEHTDGRDVLDRDVAGFDLLILDLSLSWRDESVPGGQRDRSGLDLLRELYERSPIRESIDSRTTKVLILSQHLADSSWRVALSEFGRATGIPAALRSKYGFRTTDIDLAQGASLRSYVVQVITDALSTDDVGTLAKEVIEAAEAATTTDPFEISFDDYRVMSDVEKAALQDIAFARLKARAKSAFRDGDTDWVVYCGDPTTPVLFGRDTRRPPSAHELRVLAEEKGHPAFVIVRSYADLAAGPALEEIERPSRRKRLFGRRGDRLGSGDFIFRCGGDLSDYPTISVELGRRMRTLHLDTGSAESWLLASDVREHGVALDVIDRRMVDGKRGLYYVYPLEDPLECTLHDQQSQNTFGVTVRGSAVEESERWDYAKFCAEHDCPHGDVYPTGECIVRSGIAGRTLIADNDLTVTIYAQSDETHVRRPR